MANNISAAKRQRQNEKSRLRNKEITSRIKHTARKLLGIIKEKKNKEAGELLLKYSSIVDKAVTKGVLHRNTAARKKSRMQLKLNSIQKKA